MSTTIAAELRVRTHARRLRLPRRVVPLPIIAVVPFLVDVHTMGRRVDGARPGSSTGAEAAPPRLVPRLSWGTSVVSQQEAAAEGVHQVPRLALSALCASALILRQDPKDAADGALVAVHGRLAAARAQAFAGNVKTVVSDRGFGFLTGDDGHEYFFHRTGVDSIVDFDRRGGGEQVSFDLEESNKGHRARSVRMAQGRAPSERQALPGRRTGRADGTCGRDLRVRVPGGRDMALPERSAHAIERERLDEPTIAFPTADEVRRDAANRGAAMACSCTDHQVLGPAPLS